MLMRHTSAAGAALALLCTLSSAQAVVEPPEVTNVSVRRVPHGGLQPEAIVDGRGVLHMLYFAGEPRGGDLFYVRSTDSGASFSDPVRVNSQPGSVIASGTIRGGQMAVGPDGRIHVGWNGSDAAQPRALPDPTSHRPTAPYLYSRSTDGKTFEPQRNLIQRGYSLDGGGSIAADAAGHVYAAWHANPATELPGENHRRVWIARSRDGGRTFAAEEIVSSAPPGVCSCCGVRLLATTTPRALFVLYRAAPQLDQRDVRLLVSTDAGRSFRASDVQPWKIAACPMTSMALASDGARVVGAWETAGQVYFAEISRDDATIVRRIAAPSEPGGRKHPRVATAANGERLLVWTEGTAWARGGSIAWQRFDKAGAPIGATASAPDLPAWSFAAAARTKDGAFVVFY
jgi:hypothetical protein